MHTNLKVNTLTKINNMRKNNFVKLAIVVLLLTIGFNACNNNKVLNNEADILTIKLPEDMLIRDAVIENNKITCYVKNDLDVTNIAPKFELSAGASITPPSGAAQDFSKPVSYVVKSEDGKYTKTYIITFVSGDDGMTTNYHFDEFEWKPDKATKKYHAICEIDGKSKVIEWASGNAGYALTAGTKPASAYPTFMAEEGFKKHSAKLTTCSTGTMGMSFGSPIAAGNLYLGSFSLDITNPLKSTRMGIPFIYTPVRLKGYYKYKSGDKYVQYTAKDGSKIKNGKVLNRKDSCSIYAVFYETADDLQYLDGTNIQTHPNIVSVAQLNNAKETDDWTAFDLSFIQKNGKNIDQEKLKAGKYNLTIVFSSSKEGDLYNGALGSTLFIDEVELISQ